MLLQDDRKSVPPDVMKTVAQWTTFHAFEEKLKDEQEKSFLLIFIITECTGTIMYVCYRIQTNLDT